MKTRREFLRLALGSIACLGAVITVPGILIAKEKNPFCLENVKKGAEKIGYATSGYVRVDHGKDSVVPQVWTVTATFPEGTTEWVTVNS
ncbi:hypothetical protein LCGC14_1761840 [marine sediment metagenome]|uniref:Uncharacterized protein n=1 Tax=marine sediment metagenome TaxID=412755 RepID=A0A0F9K0E9_9ZZZZ|nr:hypothetical protein [Candidatus Aminicenantes bacterium]